MLWLPLHACLFVPCGTNSADLRYQTVPSQGGDDGDEIDVDARRKAADEPGRERILDAAFSAFMEGGFAETSTLEIATRARVSKAQALRAGWQQTGYAGGMHRRARQTVQVPADLPSRMTETLCGC